MSEPQDKINRTHIPQPTLQEKKSWVPSIVWLIPLIAALLGIGLIVKTIINQGPEVTIQFNDVQGLEAGKTVVKYKNVEIGYVKYIRLSNDLSHVLVRVQLKKEAKKFATQNSKFWIVRPRIGVTGISGLNTLISGSYINADPGNTNLFEKSFIGLESPPAITSLEQGRQYILEAKNLGSIDIGTPVYYRHVNVGQVVNFRLDPEGKEVNVHVFIRSPYDQLIHNNTRWWHASGIDLSLNAEGLRVNTESLSSIITGGIAFQTPDNVPVEKQSETEKQHFKLAASEAEAMSEPDSPPVKIIMVFNQSLRGLSVGAPVDFRGINVGSVTHIHVKYNEKTNEFLMPVSMSIYPGRLGHQFFEQIKHNSQKANQELLNTLVAKGLRGQLRVGNLLTDQLYIALDFFPKDKKAVAKEKGDVIELPTVSGSINQVQSRIENITQKLDKIPFDEIGKNLNNTLKSTNALLQENSPLQQDIHHTLQEMNQTLQSIKNLSDYLEQHPESLIRGKKNEDPNYEN